jgi:hypothetical protein
MLVGWDWASATHDVTVLDDVGVVVDRWAFRHTEQDLVGALERLARLAEPAALPVIIERASGLVVERLLAAGHPVVAGAPDRVLGRTAALGCVGGQVRSRRQLQAGRLPAYRRASAAPAGPTRPRPPRAASAGAAARGPCAGPHRGQHEARRPAGGALARAQGGVLPAGVADRARLLADYPTPQAAARLGQARMASFCRRHSYRGGKTPAQLLARLHSAPTAPVGIPAATLAILVRAQVEVLRSLLGTIAELQAAIATRVAASPRVQLLAALPGVGTINLAQLLAEVGPILDRVDNAEQAAAECGAAPVTRASGKTTGVYFRWAANRRARKALTAFAHNARMQSPWAARLYADARARGKRNPHATRIVARAWLRVIWACWHTGTPYDPHAHLAEQRLAAA